MVGRDNHHDDAGGHEYADQLKANGAGVVLNGLADVLGRPEAPSVKASSSVTFVAELERSVSFYQKLFACTVSARQGNAALLMAPTDSKPTLVAKGSHQGHPTAAIGEHHLI